MVTRAKPPGSDMKQNAGLDRIVPDATPPLETVSIAREAGGPRPTSTSAMVVPPIRKVTLPNCTRR